jgi:hypothetical protein
MLVRAYDWTLAPLTHVLAQRVFHVGAAFRLHVRNFWRETWHLRPKDTRHVDVRLQN